ncbi:MAG: hypothetical protein ACOZE5_05540 [Verrucomicrobiota bacterium]
MWTNIFKEAFTQLLALVAFFAFPAIQYFWLKHFVRKEGQPVLWYLPKYGFRLVISNIPGRKVLSEIKVRTRVRRIVASSAGASAATFMDQILVEQEEMFVFPGSDQVLVSFRLELSPSGKSQFVFTDKLGVSKQTFETDSFDKLVCDYVANVENLLNFDIKLGKRVELKTETLKILLTEIQADPDTERSFPVDRVREVT